MKTLFVSDLDGTLLNRDVVISEYSIRAINSLIDQGMCFTLATARSPWTVKKIVSGLNITYPTVLLNGVCVYDVSTERFIKINGFESNTFTRLLSVVHEYGLSGFLYMVKGNELIVLYENVTTPNALAFMKERRERFGKEFLRAYPITEYDFGGMIPVYYTVSDKTKTLYPFYEEVCKIKGLHAEFYHDIYNKDLCFLELLSDKTSKSSAIDFIKDNYGFERVVAATI